MRVFVRDFLCLGLLADALFWLAGGHARIQRTKDDYCAAAGRVMAVERQSWEQQAETFREQHEMCVENARQLAYAEGQCSGRQEMYDYLWNQHAERGVLPSNEDFASAKRRWLH